MDHSCERHVQDTHRACRRPLDPLRVCANKHPDLIVITTDSGRLVTYEYENEPQHFKTIHYETFGKSGIRRVVPGEYLAADPKGRAIMIASTLPSATYDSACLGAVIIPTEEMAMSGWAFLSASAKGT